VPVPPQPCHQFQAVFVRQVQVEQQQVRAQPSSLRHHRYRIVRRGCRVHVVPATWMWRPCRIRRARAGPGAESPSHGNAAGTQQHQGSHLDLAPPVHDLVWGDAQ
jgi:hypothetical protein